MYTLAGVCVLVNGDANNEGVDIFGNIFAFLVRVGNEINLISVL